MLRLASGWLRRGLWRRELFHVVDQSAEPELAKESLQGGDIWLRVAARLPIEVQIEVLIQSDECLAETGLIGEDLEVLFELRAGCFIGIGENSFEGLELLKKRRRLLRSDEWHAWHVIDRIADERLKVDHLIGADTPIGEQRGFVEVRVLSQIENLDLWSQQLAGVFVAGDDPHLIASRDGLSRQRRDHVVGFPSGAAHDRNAKRLNGLD